MKNGYELMGSRSVRADRVRTNGFDVVEDAIFERREGNHHKVMALEPLGGGKGRRGSGGGVGWSLNTSPQPEARRGRVTSLAQGGTRVLSIN
jgi:hypothetical protein